MGTALSERGHSIIKTIDGRYAAGGFIGNSGQVEMGIVKLDANCMPEWVRTAGVTTNDYANPIIQTSDAGYVIAGYSAYFGAGGADAYVAKFDINGVLQWIKAFGTAGFERARSIVQTTDGGYLITGETSASSIDFYFLKLRSDGTFQWSKSIDLRTTDRLYSTILNSDGSSVSVGGTNFSGSGADMYIVKLDSRGGACGTTKQVKTQTTTGGTATSPAFTVSSQYPVVTLITPTMSAGGTVTTICSRNNSPIGQQEKGTDELHEIPMQFKLEQNYPNPFNPKTNIKYQIAKNSYVVLKVYDLLGSEVETLLSEELIPGTYEIRWDASNYPSGIYYYKLTAGEYSETKKMVLIK
jgi:hypothetical protein